MWGKVLKAKVFRRRQRELSIASKQILEIIINMANNIRQIMDLRSLQVLLERIGLNHHESMVYTTLLTHGQKPASAIAQLSGTPRSTIRSILDTLCDMGIVDKIYRGNAQYYSCLPSGALVRSIEQDVAEKKRHADAVREMAPFLDGLRNTENQLPLVRYFEGEKGIIEAFNHSLISGAREILFITSYDFFQTKRIRDYDMKDYLPSRIRRGIHMRVLSERNTETSYWHKRSKNELREHRFMPKDAKLPGNFFIYDRFVLYFSANKGEYIAVLTESGVMAATMRTLFECLWEQKN
jgi:sugar-specific transcriptional regulator TrmB